MSWRLEYSKTAIEDLDRMFRCIEEQNGDDIAASRLLERLKSRAEWLANSDFQLGSPAAERGVEALRKWVDGNFKLYLDYSDDVLMIAAIDWGGQDRYQFRAQDHDDGQEQ